MGEIMSSSPQIPERAISRLVPAVFAVFRKINLCACEIIMEQNYHFQNNSIQTSFMLQKDSIFIGKNILIIKNYGYFCIPKLRDA
jgi:hypothetical protein